MPISYKAVPNGTPGVTGGGEQKYYASIVRGRKVGLRTFVGEIAEYGLREFCLFRLLNTTRFNL